MLFFVCRLRFFADFVFLSFLYKLKKDRLGNIIRHKCRLVAQGFYQVFGQDYTDTYSSVAKFTSIRTLLAISAQLGLQVRQMDVDTAFLNASISENIWVKVPDRTELNCHLVTMEFINSRSHCMD